VEDTAQIEQDENPVLFEQIFLAYARDISPAVKDSASKKHRICKPPPATGTGRTGPVLTPT